MAEKLTQEEIDALADVIWWVKGYRASGATCDLDSGHLEALRKACVTLMALNEQGPASGSVGSVNGSVDATKPIMQTAVERQSLDEVKRRRDDLIREIRDEQTDAAMREQYYRTDADWAHTYKAIEGRVPERYRGDLARSMTHQAILQAVRPLARDEPSTVYLHDLGTSERPYYVLSGRHDGPGVLVWQRSFTAEELLPGYEPGPKTGDVKADAPLSDPDAVEAAVAKYDPNGDLPGA